jgi:hypothetical protein
LFFNFILQYFVDWGFCFIIFYGLSSMGLVPSSWLRSQVSKVNIGWLWFFSDLFYFFFQFYHSIFDLFGFNLLAFFFTFIFMGLSQSYAYDCKVSELTRIDSNKFFSLLFNFFFLVSPFNIELFGNWNLSFI